VAVLPPIPADVGELDDDEKALVLRATASKAIPWRVARRSATGDLILEATVPAGSAHPGMVRDATLTRTPSGLIAADGVPRAA
jgi:hypothetical protein